MEQSSPAQQAAQERCRTVLTDLAQLIGALQDRNAKLEEIVYAILKTNPYICHNNMYHCIYCMRPKEEAHQQCYHQRRAAF